MTQIAVLGLGRVGLVTAVCLARKGYRVLGVDPDRRKVERIGNAEPPFFEPKLGEYIREVVGNGSFSVTHDLSTSAKPDLVYITVGTPSNEKGTIELAYVRDAAISVGQSLRNVDRYQLIVIKSTVTPGTAGGLVRPTVERESGKTAGRDFGLCSNPEFLREGRAIDDNEHPDRIVIGSDDPEAINRLQDFYEEFYTGHRAPVIRTTHENAELIKYANNAFLATKVSFINCIANITERIPNADVKSIAAGIGLDQRIGTQFLDAGLGWGGSCFPKDLSALVAFSESLGYSPQLIKAAIETNKRQWRRAIELARQALGSLKGKRVAVLGLAFKPDTDDVREAVSIPLMRGLLTEGAEIVAYDPAAVENTRALLQDAIEYARDPMECVDQADCCIIATEWNEFRTIPPADFYQRMRQPILIDGRRLYEAEKFWKAGIQLYGIGLGPRATTLNETQQSTCPWEKGKRH